MQCWNSTIDYIGGEVGISRLHQPGHGHFTSPIEGKHGRHLAMFVLVGGLN